MRVHIYSHKDRGRETFCLTLDTMATQKLTQSGRRVLFYRHEGTLYLVPTGLQGGYKSPIRTLSVYPTFGRIGVSKIMSYLHLNEGAYEAEPYKDGLRIIGA
jgi:hypothetical protein